MSDWTTADIPSQRGRLAVITGATGGLGYETALKLAGAGATVVLTGRNDAKGASALARIRARFPDSHISYETLDLASLASIAAFAARFAAAHTSLDLLTCDAPLSFSFCLSLHGTLGPASGPPGNCAADRNRKTTSTLRCRPPLPSPWRIPLNTRSHISANAITAPRKCYPGIDRGHPC